MAVYGVDTFDFESLERPFAKLADSPEGWRRVFEGSLGSISDFLAARDPWAIVAKTSSRLLANNVAKREQIRARNLSGGIHHILTETVDVEILQALALMQTSSPP